MTRKEQILKAAEFDSMAANNFIDSHKGQPFIWEENESPLQIARWQHEQNKPLISAMADRIEQLEGALGETNKELGSAIGCSNSWEEFMGTVEDVRESVEEALGPCALDALLKREG